LIQASELIIGKEKMAIYKKITKLLDRDKKYERKLAMNDGKKTDNLERGLKI
jgi:hypothetical protein